MKSPAIRALLGLTLGLIVGALIVWSNSSGARMFATAMDPVGTLWVNALRMTVVPLVVSLLITTLAENEGGTMFGVLGRRALFVFLALLIGMAIVGLALAPPIYSRLTVDPAASASLHATAAANMPATTPPTFATWFTGLVPANVVKAASDGAMLPLIVFAVIFGLALGRVEQTYRTALVSFFRAIAGAMLAVVQWVLLLAPIGAFALAVTVATHLGNATAYVILFYIVSHCALLLVLALLLYAIIPVVTRTPIARYAKALLPAQVVVITTRSSLAALPVMLDRAVSVLGLPSNVASFALPLGVSLLRASTGLSYVVYALFLGKLYGIPLGFGQLLFVATIGIVMSFSVPGIPSGGLLIAAPYFQMIGLPPQGIGILIALDAIPDIFKTLVIVQSHMSAALVLSTSYTPSSADQYSPS
ncbi:MAG TPA: dicarboxylate/amino acid:cation symporter [Gemmatimonadaceae bacterium]